MSVPEATDTSFLDYNYAYHWYEEKDNTIRVPEPVRNYTSEPCEYEDGRCLKYTVKGSEISKHQLNDQMIHAIKEQETGYDKFKQTDLDIFSCFASRIREDRRMCSLFYNGIKCYRDQLFPIESELNVAEAELARLKEVREIADSAKKFTFGKNLEEEFKCLDPSIITSIYEFTEKGRSKASNYYSDEKIQELQKKITNLRTELKNIENERRKFYFLFRDNVHNLRNVAEVNNLVLNTDD